MNIDLWLCALDPTASTQMYVSEFGNNPTQHVAIEMSNALGYCTNYHTVEQVRQMIAALTNALNEISKTESK